jgi:lysine 2,3-aminomutase
MKKIEKLERIAISVRSHRLLKILMKENPEVEKIFLHSKNDAAAIMNIKEWLNGLFNDRAYLQSVINHETYDKELFDRLTWQDFAIIRLYDYVQYANFKYEDPNLRGEFVVSNPLRLLWLAVNRGTGGAKPDFFIDMIELFRQLRNERRVDHTSEETLREWMERYPSGLDPRIVQLRKENRDRILTILIKKIEAGIITSKKFSFPVDSSFSEKFEMALEWWNNEKFHLHFAVRSPELLNEMLNFSLDSETMQVLKDARLAGIPFFVNLYYLSLLHVRVPYFAVGADLAIRNYVLYSRQLVEEFGHIIAWEKEDEVEAGKPNAAGWILPNENNIHRRYPEVAILIPDSMGRACGGLCSVCQRMYNFQSGHLNFNLDKLKPTESWPEKLRNLMAYFEEDSRLRDILITGGDAFMSSNATIENILEEVFEMASRKREKNKRLPDGEKLAEIVRVRFGSRLPVYLPQRINRSLINILRDFRIKATKIGIKQFVIQTHIQSAMEVTPEARSAIERLQSAGWLVVNQLVFTTAASRRGHSAKLRKVLSDIGVLPYYTFSVKGYRENSSSFVPTARLLQEGQEEKVFGRFSPDNWASILKASSKPESIVLKTKELKEELKIPFLASDRSVINLPGVGKSLTFRVVGITRYGRRILEFDYDNTRLHSPIIKKMGKVCIVEAKSIHEYLNQLEEMGENKKEYKGLYGYSMGLTEERLPVFDYPDYEYNATKNYTNLNADNILKLPS